MTLPVSPHESYIFADCIGVTGFAAENKWCGLLMIIGGRDNGHSPILFDDLRVAPLVLLFFAGSWPGLPGVDRSQITELTADMIGMGELAARRVLLLIIILCGKLAGFA